MSFVTVAAGREPVIVGKPSTLAKDILEAAHGGFTADRTLMVGDRCVLHYLQLLDLLKVSKTEYLYIANTLRKYVI